MIAFKTGFALLPLTKNFSETRNVASYVIRMTELAFMLRMIAERRTVPDLKIIAIIGDHVLTHSDHPAF